MGPIGAWGAGVVGARSKNRHVVSLIVANNEVNGRESAKQKQEHKKRTGKANKNKGKNRDEKQQNKTKETRKKQKQENDVQISFFRESLYLRNHFFDFIHDLLLVLTGVLTHFKFQFQTIGTAAKFVYCHRPVARPPTSPSILWLIRLAASSI